MKRFQPLLLWALVFFFYGTLSFLPVNAQNAKLEPAFKVMAVGPVVYSSHFIDDVPGGTSPNGDGDGRAECGEHVGLSVTVLNQGNETAVGVESYTLTCSDPDITILDSENCWPDIPGGQTRENGCNYEFQVNPNLAQNKTVTFTMTVTAQNGGPWVSSFAVQIYGPDPTVGPVVYASHSINDDNIGESHGDGDGQAEGGERVELAVALRNQGSNAAIGVTAVLSTTDSDVTIVDNENYWPDIPGGATRDNSGQFVFDVNPNLSQQKSVTFFLTANANTCASWTSSFSLTIFPSTPPPSADLVADRIYLRSGPNLTDPEVNQPVVGQQYYIFFDWRNVGSGAANNFRVENRFNGNVQCASTNQSASANSNFVTRCTNEPVTWPAGANTIEGRLDVNNVISESNENNNNLSRTYTITAVGPVVYSSHFIDDVPGGTSPNGDGDGRAECGEHVGLSVTLLNQGNQTAVGVQSTTLICSDPDVTILDSNNCWPDIPGGQTRENACNYEFQVNPNLAQNKMVTFTMTITAQNGGPWVSTFDVELFGPDPNVGPVVLASRSINDDNVGESHGDGDGQAEGGERIELAVALRNQGSNTAIGVTAVLSATDSDVTIVDNENYWPDIPGGATRDNLGQFVFDVNPNLSQQKSVTFFLTANANTCASWTSSFTIPISPPPNRTPVVVNAISNQNLTIGGASFVRNLTAAPVVFSDPDGDALTYTASSNAPSKATASLSGSMLTVTPINIGNATITITANDGRGGTASTSFNVAVTSGTIQPEIANITQPIGGEFEISVSVNNVQNLFGISFEINYTNTVHVDYVTSTPGDFLGNDVIFLPTPDDPAGRVSIGISRKAGQPGSNGSGVVAKVKFKSLTTTPPGTQVVFSLSTVLANDPAGGNIPLASSATLTIRIDGRIVWPGDATNDGVVNQADVLPLGLHWNRTGPPRQNASTTWIGQAATPWSPEAATYADANGDGVVNQADVLPIGLNWGRTHTSQHSIVMGDGEASVLNKTNAATIRLAVTGDTNPDQDFLIEVAVDQVTSLFGVSFELLYSPAALVDPQSAEAGGFIGNDVVFFPNFDKPAGKIGIGVTRKTGQSGVNGSGTVARIRMRVSSQAVRGQVMTFTLQNITANDSLGQSIPLNLASASTPVVVSVASRDHGTLPTVFALHANAPNPFNPSTEISYDLPINSVVRVDIYDVLGQHVRTLVHEQQQAGSYSVTWDGRNDIGQPVTSGVFIYQLRADDPAKGGAGKFVQSRRMLLLR